MKSIIYNICLLALWSWCVVDCQIQIIRKEQKVVGDNKSKDYKFIIETANGIYQEEQGLIKNADEPGYETQLAQGQYQYVSPEGEVIQVQYTADENGFRPVGKHIPTPPPIPKDIQKALDYLATKKPDPASQYEGEDTSFLTLPK